MTKSEPLVVILGPTASGKSDLGLRLAKIYDGEIICADSRTVYRGLDIGTAKPSKSVRKAVVHHLLDIADPDDSFTAADFKQLANKAIEDILSRGKLPIMVGGSGLYIDSVIFDYSFAPAGAKRDTENPRHLSKAVLHKRKDLRAGTLLIGLDVSRDILQQKIAQRVDAMLKNGLENEVKNLCLNYPNSKALQAPGYKAFVQYLEGKIVFDEAKRVFINNDKNLAKRQMTWFRRNPDIRWIHNFEEANLIVRDFLSKFGTMGS